MKVLFVMHTINRLRNFDGVVRALADRGHTVRLAFLQKGELKLPAALEDPRIRIGPCAKGRGDDWGAFTRPLRRMRDAVRYLQPRFRRANKLRARAFEGIDFPFGQAVIVLYHLGWVRFLFAPMISRVLAFLERMMPSDEGRINAFLRAENPDVILISPLVQRGSEYQVDYVKGAHDLGIPVAVMPFSWDNLTNKGHMKAVPDKVLVWNEVQRQESIRLHDVPEDRITVCGAWRFDQFFAMKPRTSKEDYCRLLNLDPSSPIVTYLCSSEFTSENEADFVLAWIQSLRRSKNPLLQKCNILIRPYPDHIQKWRLVDLSEFRNVMVVPANLFGESRDASWGDQCLYDTLFHSSAVMGLNTSAMIEAAILGKPVHTVLIRKFRGGQADTLHFHYLLNVNGGLLRVAKSLGAHCEQLVESLGHPNKRDPKSEKFVRAFVRPFGEDVAATPRVVEEIEKLAATFKPKRVSPAWETAFRPHVLSLLKAADFGFSRLNLSRGWRVFARSQVLEWAQNIWRKRYAEASAPAAPMRLEKIRVDYLSHNLYIYANSSQERRWQAQACADEPWTVQWIEKCARDGGVLYDIGARLGVFAIVAGKLQNGNGQNKVFAFEPRLPSFFRLCENIQLNDCSANVIPVPVSLSSETRIIGLGNGSGTAPTTEAPIAFRLDELVEKKCLPKPAHIRLDCSGNELEVLKGAPNILRESGLRTLLVEMGPSIAAPVQALMRDTGFALEQKFGDKHYLFRRAAGI
jgi:FkbM family methyltransferase